MHRELGIATRMQTKAAHRYVCAYFLVTHPLLLLFLFLFQIFWFHQQRNTRYVHRTRKVKNSLSSFDFLPYFRASLAARAHSHTSLCKEQNRVHLTREGISAVRAYAFMSCRAEHRIGNCRDPSAYIPHGLCVCVCVAVHFVRK